MDQIINYAQPGIFREPALAGLTLEWSLAGDAGRALERLGRLNPENTVVGLGQPLLTAAGKTVDGFRAFTPITGKASMPATQQALWTYVRADTQGDVFSEAERIAKALDGSFESRFSLPLFLYQGGRDLTGYKDGTANPEASELPGVVLMENESNRGASVALVQQYRHARDRFNRLTPDARDDVMGRRFADDEEIEDAPETSHVKRTDQEGYDEPAFMLRRSMPWGDPANGHGLYFIAFANDLERIDLVLRRMCGVEDGKADALLGFTDALTGGYYYCPPLRDGRLDLRGMR